MTIDIAKKWVKEAEKTNIKEEFDLSKEIWNPEQYEDCEVIETKHVKEFIRLLKEDIINSKNITLYGELNEIINKRAGEKLCQ